VKDRDSCRLPVGSGERWADDYERSRPGWPPEVVDVANVPSAALVLELGAGTGKLTRLLVPRFERVIAVEPQEAMRRRLVARCPDADVRNGSAERIPVGDGSVHTVFVAEAFHKFDAARTIGEVTRVLRPGGPFILMWNTPAGPVEPSIEEVNRVVQRLLQELELSERTLGYDPNDLRTDRFLSGEWRIPFASWPFTPLQESVLSHTQTLDREGLVAFYASMGWLADLPDSQRLPALEEIRSRLTATEYRRSWHTHIYWTHLAT